MVPKWTGGNKRWLLPKVLAGWLGVYSLRLIRECVATVLTRGRTAERKPADSMTAMRAWRRASFLGADLAERTQWKKGSNRYVGCT